MKRKQCPVCRSSNIVLFGGGITGNYECRNCGYVGVFITETVPTKRKKK